MCFFIIGSDYMKHEDIPGFVELRRALFQNRLREKFTRDADERAEIASERTEINHKIARLLYEYNEQKKQEERGRKR